MNYTKYLAGICITLLVYCSSILPDFVATAEASTYNYHSFSRPDGDFNYEIYSEGSTVANIEINSFNISRIPVNDLRNYNNTNLNCQLIRDHNLYNNSKKYQFRSINNEGRFDCTDIIYPAHYFW